MDETIVTSMITELRRGTLSLMVLSQLFDKQYGYSLLQRLAELNTHVDASTLYPMLRRLDKQGILESTWDTSESRPRKYYQLNSEGKVVYQTLLNEWKKICGEMKFLEGVN